MIKSKWIMKQYWRVGTIRTIVSVLQGMLVLGRYYYQIIPFYNSFHPSIIGAFLLAGTFLLIFLIAGYVYDAKLELWNEQTQVTVEKDPYQYVPNPRIFQLEYPILYAVIDTLRKILIKRGMNTDKIDRFVLYLDGYFKRLPDNREDLFTAEGVAKTYMEEQPFGAEPAVTPKQGIRSKIKKGFQLRVWRLTWVQGFTGLAQDVLVFAAFYIVILFPNAVTESGVVTLNYLIIGVLFISLPLYICLVIGGYYYDKKLRMWSPDTVVKVERTPFSYVSSPHIQAFVYPFLFAMLSFYYSLFMELNLDVSDLKKTIDYFEQFFDLRPEITSHIDLAKKLRSDLGLLFNNTGVG